MAEVESPFYISIICTTCAKERYRSSRPFTADEKIVAADFDPIDDAPEPPDSGPMLCYECSSLMKPLKTEAWLNASKGRTASAGVPVAPRPETKTLRSDTETLFELVGDEQMICPPTNHNGSLVITTTRRIVRVRL